MAADSLITQQCGVVEPMDGIALCVLVMAAQSLITQHCGVVVECMQRVALSFGDGSRFTDNLAEFGGGVYVHDSTVSFTDSKFTGNSAGFFGGCMAAKFSNIIVNIGGSSHFMNNSAKYGGCIFVYICELTFGGSHILANSSGGYGGALYLTVDGKIYLQLNTTLYFESNFAQYRGGALLVEDNPFTYCITDSDVHKSVLGTHACFIQFHVYEAGCNPVDEENRTDAFDHSIELRFQDNAASEAGNGGNLDSCGVCTSQYWYVTGEVAFSTWTDVPSNLMSSGPCRVCICVDNHPNLIPLMKSFQVWQLLFL